jgi:uracil-DNA glycosylase family 4
MSEAGPDPAWLAALADNLTCRERLGLSLVDGDLKKLQRLVANLSPSDHQPSADQMPESGSLGGATPSAASSLGGLAQVRAAMGECTRCPLHEGRRKIVFGKGAENAEVMFIGEGPGAEEDRQGLPFVGRAGQLLDRMLAAIGMKTSEVYITNIVKCRPPGNRDPQALEVAACRPFLEAQVRAVGPKIICTLGKPAANALLDNQAPISALRGNWHRFEGVPVLPMFHPAFLLRQPERKGLAYQDLKALAKALRQGPPEA